LVPDAGDAGDVPFVSIVVPTRNRATDLRVCLESLAAQEYPPERFEVVVVDDGSSDDTPRVVHDARRRGNVRLIQQPHLGSNAARNAGLQATTSDPVCLVDDDVEVPAAWLSAMTAGFARYSDADAFAGPVRVHATTTDATRSTCPLHPLVSTLDAGGDDRPVEAALGANMAVRRRALERIGPFDDWILIGGADTDWFNRLQEAGGRAMYLAGAGLWHHQAVDRTGVARLVRKEFGRGIALHRYALRRGHGNWRHSLAAGAKLFGHAARHRCRGALAQSARAFGAAYGILRYRNLTPPPPPPQAAPPPPPPPPAAPTLRP
jgi:glycosyltransferase involved in cell wall biosynthesis